MVSVEVLCVGRELLIGKTLNTNVHWMGARLARMGGMINRIITVTDSLNEISSALREILSRNPDFVIVVGGLGPTPDDMTLRGVALALGRRVKANREAIQLIKDHYKEVWKGEVVLTPARRKMAALPEGSTPQHNPVGTAPGVRIESGETVIYCLPGVPKEMKAIFRESVEKEIRKKMGKIFTETVIMDLEGIYESTLAPILRKAGREFPHAYIKSHPKGLKEGRSMIELDIVISNRRQEKVLREIRALKEILSEEIAKAKGLVVRIRETI